jgi:hypothetical protein
MADTMPPLDERLYSLSDHDLQFFKSQIGIEDDALLKAHIIEIQAKAYEVCLVRLTSRMSPQVCRYGLTLAFVDSHSQG